MLFDVHIYREMRLRFDVIEAETHEAAAEIARNLPLKMADDVDECDGETFYACVDVQGDDEYERSRWIDFADERLRVAAPKLLAACKTALAAMEAELETEDPQARIQIEWDAEPMRTLREVIAEAEGALAA